MAKTIDISLDSFKELYENVLSYFSTLSLYQGIAWGAIGLGIVLIVVAVILW